jgi:hypothetical protein
MEAITKIANKNYRLDLANNRITFLDNRFYFHENGNYYPSSTTILDAYPKSAGFYEWLKRAGDDADSIRDEAGRKGSVVHDLTEKYDDGLEVNLLNEYGDVNIRMSEWNMLEKYVEFRNRFKTEVIHSELNMVSAALQYGGTLDRVMMVEGRKLLVDIKTSNAIYNHYWLQLASYARLYAEQFDSDLEGVAILWLNAKTKTDGKSGTWQGKGWQLIVEQDQKEIDRYWKLFQATQRLWIEENGSAQPKKMEYKLSHKFQSK